jgi:membrane fusion protein (multidrug efflux system)
MRARDLTTRKVISKADLDAAESKFKQKEGIVAKKEVRAPFDGQLGIRQVNVGQMIKEGQQVVQLTALDPVYVDFALPQQELAKISAGLEVRVRTDAVPGREFKGKLTAINSMVDTVTRNVSLQGTLENPDHTLRPGIFAKVDLLLPEKRKALVVPGSAISYAPFGDSVFVIETKKDPKTGKETQSIRQQFVKIGEARGDLVAITDGLKANETIVGTGVFKLRNGTTVIVNNDLAPKPQEKPKPVDS